MSTSVLVLLGSLRAASTNRQLAETLVESAPDSVSVSIYDGLGSLPLYNEDTDVEDGVSAEVTKLRTAIGEADAVLVVTPAHNGTVPAALKNAIDWASRPFGRSSLSGTPAAVIGTSLGQNGGSTAHEHARQALKISGATVVDDVVLSIPGSLTRFAETHPREDAEVLAQLRDVLGELVDAASQTIAA
ncbi:NAD(P)H-dependent oxidoreductase [Paramicrobacterium sp. CJ85]|uniref:NAD(P)H-dependent oxidoreductase n=1 Tax=Paramicrobacterium sp. CJ85 TaxID=3445355 RepID=UPI003F63FD36